MPIGLREDVMYILLQKIQSTTGQAGEKQGINFTETDFTGIPLSKADLLGHLDYLNQKHFIDADFSGNAYGNQEDVPDAVNPKEVDIRIANTFGAADGPLPHLIEFQRAKLTEKGKAMLAKMEENKDKFLHSGPSVAIATKNMPFLEKVMLKSNLEDIFDARDIAEVVFRTMRDLMTTEAAERVESELHEESLPTENKTIKQEIAELWHDTNPIVSFLSRVRPPLKFDSDTFLFRIRQEGGLQRDTNPERAVMGVFSATKDELSAERVAEIAQFLPDSIRQLWEQA
ncbi:MAG: DUF2267 domain-containing protein [Chloroflexaceae bacterium]|nr:DUF2267 domain-containing protein [Chloroflexaceae bacterium]